jgi:hypothetical protein
MRKLTQRQFLKLSGADINSVRAAAEMGLGTMDLGKR